MDLNWDLYNLEADVQIPTTLDSLASPPYQSWITDHGILPLFFSVVSHSRFVIKSPDQACHARHTQLFMFRTWLAPTSASR